MTQASTAIFASFHEGLLKVHRELREAVGRLLVELENPEHDVTAPLGAFCEELLNHHKAEDSFFFPAFRAAGRLRSSDVAFLDARDREHVDIHRLAVVLGDARQARQRGGIGIGEWTRLVRTSLAELKELSLPHFAEEEATFTPEHVATLITAGELSAVYRDMGRNWNRR